MKIEFKTLDYAYKTHEEEKVEQANSFYTEGISGYMFFS